MSDGTSSLTCGTPEVIAGQGQVTTCYILSSVASGTNSVVYTASFDGGSTSVSHRCISVQTFSKTGSASKVAESVGASAWGAAVADANLAAAGSDLLTIAGSAMVGVKSYSGETVNGTAASYTNRVTGNGVSCNQWALTGTSGFTGNSAATPSASDSWGVTSMTFSAAP
jgi:hypothetical protein